MVKKILKIFLITLGSLIFLLAVMIFLAGTGYLNGFIVRTVSKQAGKSINGELFIGSMGGRIFSHFILRNIILSNGTDTILECESVEVSYSLRKLLHKDLDISLLQVNSASLFVEQEADSSWNFMKIIKESSEEPDTSKGPSDWKVDLENFRLKSLYARISALDTAAIPQSVSSDVHMKGSFYGDTLEANLDSLKIITGHPDFELVNLSGNIKKTGNLISWNNMELKLKNTFANSGGSFDAGTESAGANLVFSPLAFEDLAPFLKGSGIYGHPNISASINGKPAEYNFKINISEGKQNIALSGKLDDYKNAPSYMVEMKVENLDASSWTHDQKMKSDISGKLNINGKGFDMKENDVSIKADLADIKYGGYALYGIVTNVTKNKDHITGSLRSGTFIGQADIDFDLTDIFGNPAYDIRAGYSHVDVSKLPGMDTLRSDLNGDIIIKGKGITPEDLKAKFVLNSYHSEIMDTGIQDFTLNADYDRGSYDFKVPDIETPWFRLGAEGNGNIKKENNVSFSFEHIDLQGLLPLFGMPPVNVSGRINGRLSGSADSLKGTAKIELENILYDTVGIGKLTADVNAVIAGKKYSGSLNLGANDIKYGAYKLKSLDMTAGLSDSNVQTNLSINMNDSLKLNFGGTIEGFDNPLIRIGNLTVDLNGVEWKSINDSAFIKLNKDDVLISGFGMGSGNQQIKADGTLAFRGNEDLSVNVDSLQLESLPLESFLPYKISGNVSSAVLLKGTSERPVIDGKFMANDLSIRNYHIESIRVNMNYDNQLVKASGTVSSGLEEDINLSVDIPFRFSLSDTTKLLKDDPRFSASFSIDSLDLTEASALLPLKTISFSGFAKAHAEAKNTLSDPVITGNVAITKGGFRDKEFGMDYRNIQLNAGIDTNRLNITTFNLSAGKGKLDIRGSISLNPEDSINTNDLSLNLKASDFQAMNSGTAELNLNSAIGISGSFVRPKMKGDIKINSSRINVDYLTGKLSQKKDEPNPPLLIQALKDTVNIVVPEDTTGPGISGSDLYKNLRGELTVDLPGDTWVTGKDMNFELQGTLRVVKSSPELNLFGDMNVKRGFYKIYGRRFDFNKGIITFTGGSEFNPQLDLEIIYRFRDIEKNLRDLKLTITGKLLQPQYAFMLDNEAIEEKDAISYIAFGKSINQLGEGDKQKMSGENIALGAAVTQLSSVLKGVLQEEAGVDVFEFTGGEDWKSGNVTIGKYITNNLFLSYERSFDFDKQRNTPVSEKIMLEYQLLRNLLLKATNQDVNSGFDLIWKKTWK